MYFRKKVIATASAAVLIAATTIAGGAQTAPSASTDVDIAVSSKGVLSVSVNEVVAFPDIEYSFLGQTVNGTLGVVITDARGTAEGWSFNLRASDFKGSDEGPGDSFPVSGLSLAAGPKTVLAGNPSLAGVNNYGIGSVSDTGQEIADAIEGSGNGQYQLLYPGSLTIPGDTLVDTYTSTVIVEAVSAPQ